MDGVLILALLWITKAFLEVINEQTEFLFLAYNFFMFHKNEELLINCASV